MATVTLKDQYRDHPTLGFIDWVLRGIGQVVFQNNPISGAVVLAAIFYNSWIYGTVCLLGTIVGTATAIWLKADKGMIKDGLFGFNGALMGIALVAYTSANFTTGNVPNAHLWLYIVLCAVFIIWNETLANWQALWFAAALALVAFSLLRARVAPD